MERPNTLDPTKCKHAVRHLNGTDNPQLNAFDYSKSFIFSMIFKNNASLKQNKLFFVLLNSTLFTMVLLVASKLSICFKRNPKRKSCLLGPL